MYHVTTCPVCQANTFENFLATKDYTVSHETFQLLECLRCGFVMTSPRPEDKDLGKYYLSDAYISHSNRAKTFLDIAYQTSRNFTLRWKNKLVETYSLTGKRKGRLLDFGCGTGEFLNECRNNGIEISGVEPSDVARSQAIQKTGANIVTNIEALEDTFSAITLWHVLEHVGDLDATLIKLKNALSENGTMFIALPNLQSFDAQTYGSYWAGYDVPRHLWHFSHQTMKMFLSRHDLKLITVLPMRLDSYYVSLLSEKYKDPNSRILTMINAISTGRKSNAMAKKTKEYSSLIYIARK